MTDDFRRDAPGEPTSQPDAPHERDREPSGVSPGRNLPRVAPPAAPPHPRRGFMVMGVGFVGTAVAGVTLGPAARILTHPLRTDTTSIGGQLSIVGTRDQFSNTPTKVDLIADPVDAWNRTVGVKVGSAWVVESGGELIAMSTVCPHLGCAIDFDKEGGRFVCPCHDSFFDLDGKATEGPSPRDMDRLDLVTEDRLVRVRYERFKQGVDTKEPA